MPDRMNPPAQLPPGSIYCSNCWKPISKDAKYCPHCGSYQNYRHRQEISKETQEEWKILRSTIIFYTIYLATILPLFWIEDMNVAVGTIIISGVDVLLILSYWSISRIPILSMFGINRDTIKYGLAAIVVLSGLLVVNFSYHAAIIKFLGLQVFSVTDTFTKAGFGFRAMVFEMCLMPAVWEEIAFRGLIQTNLSKKFGKWEAILITSAMFAIIHITAISWPYLFLLGLTLGLLRWYSQSLWPVILMHFLHNLVVLYCEYHHILGA